MVLHDNADLRTLTAHEHYDKLNKVVYDYLDKYKFKDEELAVERDANYYYINYTVPFCLQKVFLDLGGEFSGDLRIKVCDEHVTVQLNTPSLNILQHYDDYLDAWVSNTLCDRPKPLWGGNTGYYFLIQTITKEFKTAETATKYIDIFMNKAYDFIKQGLAWSNSEATQKQHDYELTIKKEIVQLNKEIDDLIEKKDKQWNMFKQYRDKIKKNNKKIRIANNDF